MNDAQAKNFTYAGLKNKCPSCGDQLLMGEGISFCEREHGSGSSEWYREPTAFPVATRTARAGRFTIEGEEGFWRIPSHMHKELPHDDPGEGAVVAAIKRYGSAIPTAVIFVRPKARKRRKEVKPAKSCRHYGALIKALRNLRVVPGLTTQPSSDGPDCVVPGCERPAVARGQCRSCNNSAHILVADGRATWGELEDYGLARPLIARRRRVSQ